MNKQPLPPVPSNEEHAKAVKVLAATHASQYADMMRDLQDENHEPLTADDILTYLCGFDSRDHERLPDDLDAVECEAYNLLCAHFGVEPKAI